MQWADVVADSSLKDLPYKVELNEHGQVLMTPHWPLHSELQSVLQEELNHRLEDGRAVQVSLPNTPRGCLKKDRRPESRVGRVEERNPAFTGQLGLLRACLRFLD